MTIESPSGDMAAILEVITTVGGIPHIEADRDFYDAGVTSVMALPLLMELESRFNVSIPDDRFITARTGRAIHNLISDLQAQ